MINVEELKEILIELEEAREAVYKCYQRLGSISEVEIGRTADGSSISGCSYSGGSDSDIMLHLIESVRKTFNLRHRKKVAG